MSDLTVRTSSTEPGATTTRPRSEKRDIGDRSYGALRSVPCAENTCR